MTWSDQRTASSRQTSTYKWNKVIRPRALNRDRGICQLNGPRCTIVATEVDHDIPVHQGGTDTLDNAVSTCRPCHNDKTQQEAAAARRGRLQRGRHQPDPHPGLLPTASTPGGITPDDKGASRWG